MPLNLLLRRVARLRVYLLTLLAGLCMGLAPAPLNLWGLAWFALVPLWYQVIQPRQSLRGILLHSGLWGLAYHGLSLSWLEGLHPLTWLGLSEFTSFAIVWSCWGLITAWGTVFVLLWGLGMWGYQQWSLRWGLVHHRAWNSGLRIWVGTALWCALEALRNQGPLDWTPLGFTQSPGNLAILFLGQWSGPLAVSAAIASVNGGWAESLSLFSAHSFNPDLRPRNLALPVTQPVSVPTRFTAVGLTVLLFLLWHGVGYGIERYGVLPTSPLPQLSPRKTTIKIGIIQGNIPTREKLTGRGVQTAETRYLAGYSQLADVGVDVVITPEAALPILWEPTQPLAARLLQTIRDRQVPMLLGTFLAESGRTTQSLIALTAQGERLSHYDKVKLVPLGEYIPAWLEGLVQRLSSMTGSLSPGGLDQRLVTPVGQAAAGICFDSAFSGVLRSQVATGGQWIVIASNLDPYSTVLMAQVHAHDLMRAIETDRDLVRATNTGYSGAITHQGQTLWRSQSRVYQVQAVTIGLRNTQTLYVRWGDWLTPTLGWGGVLMMGGYSYRRRA